MRISRKNLNLLIENYLIEAAGQEMDKESIITKLITMQQQMKMTGQAYIVGPGIDIEPGDPKVIAVQALLKKLGKDLGSHGVDGDYGPTTAAAIKSFQSDHRELGAPDGKVGKNTIEKMINAAKGLSDGNDYEEETNEDPYVEEREDIDPDAEEEIDNINDEIEDDQSSEEDLSPVVIDQSPVKKEVRALIANRQFDYTKADKYNKGKHPLFKKISVASKSPKFAIGIANIVGGDIGVAMRRAEAAAKRDGGVTKVCQAPTADEKKFISVYFK